MKIKKTPLILAIVFQSVMGYAYGADVVPQGSDTQVISDFSSFQNTNSAMNSNVNQQQLVNNGSYAAVNDAGAMAQGQMMMQPALAAVSNSQMQAQTPQQFVISGQATSQGEPIFQSQAPMQPAMGGSPVQMQAQMPQQPAQIQSPKPVMMPQAPMAQNVSIPAAGANVRVATSGNQPSSTAAVNFKPAAPSTASNAVAPGVITFNSKIPASSSAAAGVVPTTTAVSALDSSSAARMNAMAAQKRATQNASEETFSINFPVSNIVDILRNVADLCNLNVVIPATLTGTTSMKLSNVTWKQVFKAALDPVGFSYVERDNLITIKSKADMGNEPMETRVFPLTFGNAAQVASSLKPMLSEKALAFSDARTNTLIVTDHPEKFTNLEKVIERMDKEEAQIMILAQFYDISNNLSDYLGVDFTGALQNINVGVSGASSATTTGGAATTAFGRTWSRVKSNVAGALPGDTRTDGPVVFSMSQLSAIINFLKTRTDTKLIANPSLVTMNNTEATINIATRRPIPEYTYNQQQGNYSISGFNYIDIGVNLKVTPKAKQDLITLVVKPEVSDSNENVTFGGSTGTNSAGSVEIPVVNSRRADTTVTIKNGYTVMIGGLMQTNKTNDETKVPGFGDIPLIGALFRNTTKIDANRNVIVLLTANQIGYTGDFLKPFDTSMPRNAAPGQINRLGVSSQQFNPYNVSDQELQQQQAVQRIRDTVADQNNQLKMKAEMESLSQQFQKDSAEQAKATAKAKTQARSRNRTN